MKDLDKIYWNEFDFNNLYNKELIPSLGNELLFCMMPIEELKLIWDSYNLFVFKKTNKYIMPISRSFNMFFSFDSNIEVRLVINIKTSLASVISVSFRNNYVGKYNGIGIGSTIRELLEVRSDVYFDEQFILVGKFPYDFILKIDNDDSTIYNLDDVIDNKIIEITVEDKSLLH
jgi:hypothetical protein